MEEKEEDVDGKREGKTKREVMERRGKEEGRPPVTPLKEVVGK